MEESTDCEVLFGEPYEIVQAGYRALAALMPNTRSWYASDAEEACRCYFTVKPDVVVLSSKLPPHGGLDTARRILSEDRSAKILVVGQRLRHPELKRALNEGVSGVVSMATTAAALIQAIERVRGGGRYLDACFACEVGAGSSNGLDSLSPREFDVLRLLTAGKTIACVSDLLRISPKTVNNHLTRIKRKLQVRGMVDLTLLAVRTGLVEVCDGV